MCDIIFMVKCVYLPIEIKQIDTCDRDMNRTCANF